MVAVARTEIAPGLCNANDGLAGLKLVAGEAVVQVPLEIKGGHFLIIRIVEPILRTKLEFGHGIILAGLCVADLFERPAVIQLIQRNRHHPALNWMSTQSA